MLKKKKEKMKTKKNQLMTKKKLDENTNNNK